MEIKLDVATVLLIIVVLSYVGYKIHQKFAQIDNHIKEITDINLYNKQVVERNTNTINNNFRSLREGHDKLLAHLDAHDIILAEQNAEHLKLKDKFKEFKHDAIKNFQERGKVIHKLEKRYYGLLESVNVSDLGNEIIISELQDRLTKLETKKPARSSASKKVVNHGSKEEQSYAGSFVKGDHNVDERQLILYPETNGMLIDIVKTLVSKNQPFAFGDGTIIADEDAIGIINKVYNLHCEIIKDELPDLGIEQE